MQKVRFKHKIKCIEKRAFLTMHGVEKQLIKNWVWNWNALGWYECPKCLAFHLTKRQGDMRSEKLKRLCREAYLRKHYPNRKSTSKLIAERMEAMYRFLTPQNKKNRLSKQEKRERRERWNKNGWTKQNSILPLEEQRKLLNKIHTA